MEISSYKVTIPQGNRGVNSALCHMAFYWRSQSTPIVFDVKSGNTVIHTVLASGMCLPAEGKELKSAFKKGLNSIHYFRGEMSCNKYKHKVFLSMASFKRCIFLFMLLITSNIDAVAQVRYFITKSTISFLSAAPLETIRASSTAMRGVLDVQSKTFAFRVDNGSFQGFNSALQQEHFNENYLQSDKYPECSFSGKIIDEIDFQKPGVYVVRAKGIMNLKGVARERIIRSNVVVSAKSLHITAEFPVLLDDHNIRIPRIVYQKIAPEIQVTMEADLSQQSTGGKP